MKTKVNYIALAFLVLLSLKLSAQSRTGQIIVSVVDSTTNEPIGNASLRLLPQNVYVKGEASGKFTVNPNPDSKAIEVKHIGYRAAVLPLSDIGLEVTVRLAREWNVLDDVVVQTGYEAISAKRNTGSVEQISNTSFNRSSSPDLIKRLAGVSTILFNDWNTSVNRSGAEPKINIRGETSLLGDASPLIIVDNFPYEGALSSINLDEVENVTVLKDAAASAIWGARAGNGVIVITTKKGKFNMPTQIEFNSTLRLVEKPNLFYLPVASSADYIEIEKMLFQNKFYNNDEQSFTRTALSPAVELLIKHRDKLIDDETLNSELEMLAQHDVRNDFRDYVYRKEMYQRHTLSGSGGNETFRFRISGGYERNMGNTRGDSNDKFTIRSENEANISKKVSVQIGLNYAQTQVRTGGLVQYGNLRAGGRDLYPYARLADYEGNPLPIARDYRESYIATAGEGNLLDWRYVPLQELMDGNQKNNDILLNLGLRYKVAKNLSAEIKYNYQHSGLAVSYLEGIDHYETRNLINRFTVINGEQVVHNFPLGGVLRETNTNQANQNGRLQLNWNPTFGKHTITTLAGAEVRQSNVRLSQHTTYGYDKDRLTSSPIDLINFYPTFDNIGGQSLLAFNPTSFGETVFRDVSFFANGIYSYDNRYILSLNARRDASNLLGMETNERWKPLWSISGAWNVNEEIWFDVGAIDRLKLRLSHGYSGNIDKSRSAHTILRFAGRYHLTQYPYAFIENPPNPALQWETVATTNIGLDMGLLNDRVRMTIDLYKKNTTNLLGMAPIDPTTGFSNVVLNNAATAGKGAELNISSRNITSGPFEWSSSLLFAYNETKVVKWLNPLSTAGAYVGNGRSLSPYEGNLLYSLYSFKWEGLNPDNGNPIGRLKGETSEDYRAIRRESEFEELVYHGSAIPLYHGSLLNTFKWRQLAVSANIGYRAGYYIRRNALHYQDLFSGNSSHREYSERWQQQGDELHTNVPSMVYPANSERDNFYQNSEINVAKGDHIRILDIRVDYAMSSKLQFFATMGNVGIIWRANKWGIDPDFANNIPQPRNYAAGLSFKF
ncbi:SusC/RagA family TonB-linked outer membrane protein [Sphingobacterium pedocola]|uniref:TonB-dependent receptor plug domain-containing protein n=1 Tax=Sphingobacterium pedocola TaxID=2082722 RepID=A0ABR9T716_9SPHI|nr:SusC/RagA family TonB-linked outer membrane protein [Sphingobacterium pedocola]MBE8720859.1 hypothetical protein [Sphingobacterium pedocola]